MLMFDTVVQTQFGSFFKAFALPTDVKPTTGVAPGSKIEEMNPATGAVDTYRWNGESWAKIDTNGTAAGSVPAVATEDKGKFLHANESTGDLEWAEGGGSGGALIVHESYSTEDGDTYGTLDKTWQEIYNAKSVVIVPEDDGGPDAFEFSIKRVVRMNGWWGNEEDMSGSVFVQDIDSYDPLEFVLYEYTCQAPDGYPKAHLY